jgi:flagellar biosynthetic protein FliR
MTSFASLAALALLLVRPGMLVIATPMFGAAQAPARMRLGLTVLLAIVLAPFVTLPTSLSAGAVTLVVLREVAIGLALALAIRVLVAAGEFAGHFAGYQIGLSLGSLIDPATGVRNNVLAILYANVVTVICFATNVHHLLMRALADSYTALPVGLGGVGAGLGANVAHVLGLVFGLLARVAPSLNMMTAGAPVRVVVGLLVVAASMSALPALLSRYVPTTFQAATGTASAFR